MVELGIMNLARASMPDSNTLVILVSLFDPFKLKFW